MWRIDCSDAIRVNLILHHGFSEFDLSIRRVIHVTGRWFFQHGTVASFHCANGMHGVLGGGDRQVMGGGVGGGQHFGIAGGGGALPPQSIILNQAHVEQSAGNGRAGWRWDSRRLALVVTIPNYDAHTQTRVEIVWAQGLLLVV